MNYLKILRPLLFISIVFCTIIFILLLLLPSHVIVSKTITIHTDKQKIAVQLNDFDNWKNWFPLFQNKNIEVVIKHHGDTSYATLANHENKKKLDFILLKNTDTIMVNLNGDDVKQTYKFMLLPVNNNETRLTWNIDFLFKKYSLRKFATIVMDKVKGPQYEDILNNLKKVMENNL